MVKNTTYEKSWERKLGMRLKTDIMLDIRLFHSGDLASFPVHERVWTGNEAIRR